MPTYLQLALDGFHSRTVIPTDQARPILASFLEAMSNRTGYSGLYFFGAELARHFAEHRSVAGFTGPAYLKTLWIDIDRPDLDLARLAAIRVVERLIGEWGIPEHALSIFFSGQKGFHIGIPARPLGLAGPVYSETTSRVYRIARELAGVPIDRIYDVTRLLRLPNSRHPESGLYKIPLRLCDLGELDVAQLRERAVLPIPWTPPVIEPFVTTRPVRLPVAPGVPRETLDDGGAPEGQRHRALVSHVGRWFGQGKTIYQVMRSTSNFCEKCDPPFDPFEAMRIVNFMARKDAASRRTAAGREDRPAARPMRH